MRRTAIFVLLLLGSLLLGACTERLPTAEEIVDRMEAARAATDDAHATVAIDFTSAEQSGRLVVEGWMQRTDVTDAAGEPISRVRAEVREASEPEMVGSIVVSDGETFWLYSPSQNTVVTGNAEDMGKEGPASPTGATAALQDLVQQGLDAVDLEVLGSEQVAGKDTWKVKVTPKSETTAQLQLDGIIEGTMWVDEELALPLKLAIDASDLGGGTVEVQSIELNTGLSADLFTFTPPAGAEIVDAAELAEQMAPRAATVEEARTSVSFQLLEPTYLPAGLALVEVRVIGTDTAILNYAGGEQSLSLVQSNAGAPGDERPAPTGSSVETVTVRGVEGTLIRGADGQGSLLRWEEAGIKYVIAGTISGEEALQTAEGLK
jgi:outer membrane lipoprotein-sorting protein